MNEEQFYQSRLKSAVLLVLAVFIIGVGGYMLLEKWNFTDSLYMTIITLTTIGYGETHELSEKGRIFTIVLILSGLGIMGYGLSITASFMVEGEFGRLVKRRRMDKKIKTLKNHFIICGAGDTGHYVVEEFIKTKTPFVVIEAALEKLEKLREHADLCYIIGDATKDASLLAAGVERARGLVSALHNDKDNLFVVLTARALNSNMKIVSRVIEAESEHKLKAAGADEVVSPNFIGGMRMASVMIRPVVVSFLDIMLRQQNMTLRLEEVFLPKGGRFVGRKLKEAEVEHHSDLIPIAIKRQEQYIYNPKPDTVLQADDALIVMGDVEQVRKLRKHISEDGA